VSTPARTAQLTFRAPLTCACLVLASLAVGRQLEVVAETLALGDGMYHLQSVLEHGRCTIDEYVKVRRARCWK
jgi:hypothetical protein